VSDLRQKQGLPEEVWNMPDLLQEFGIKGASSRGRKIQLVEQVARMAGLKEQNK